ncbi:gastrula zinc finger protein XlCGF57.1-like isoform X1 [Nilaparvata lugens]|uniref:gastrula zinc finger protein XlCGF57.1-like isoform X1 n=1 Tax=Nilaparvata lugens TaxID=108931 RepID=UPI00193D9D75|nr:gastrula zinc finger protein XlCGF57.1-like isoform X1 [Nilaparvata lugens]
MNLEEEQYGNHSGSCPVQMQPDYLDGQGQDNSRSMLNSQHQGPDMDNCDWPIHEQDQHQDTIEDKYHIQLNVDNQSVYLDHNYSKHPIEIIQIKPEELIEEDEEEEDQQLGVEVEVRSGEIKQESDTCLQIESIFSLSSDRLHSDPSVLENIKVETEEVKEEHISFKTDHSDTLMQIEDIYSDLVSENYESGIVSSGLCIPYFEEQEGSSSHRSVNVAPENTMMKDSEEICNEVDLLIENARKNVIDAASDSELTKCQLCGAAFNNTRELNLHCRAHTAGKHACKFCNFKTKWKTSLITHLRTHIGETPFSCDLCDYKAKQKSNLICHLRRHTGERPFSCDFCDHKTTRKSDLIIHLRTHTGQRPFSCDLCDYKAKQKSHLISHLRTHKVERPFSCDLCDYKTTRKSELIIHLRTHKGERPFSCDFCNYKTTRKSDLIIHLRTHTGQRPFSCDLCDYKAKQKSHLISHLRTHTGERPFSCDLCDYKATQKSDLSTHLRTHKCERPFSCDLCDYKAKQKSHLISHLRTHTGERPFSCDLCDYKATQKSTFSRHLKTHTGFDP